MPNAAQPERGSASRPESHYSARDIEARILSALRAAGLDPDRRLLPEELGALDHFHTGGVGASLELLGLAQISASDRVLDIGSGLAGPARLLASKTGCRVDCVELSADYCAGAALLNRLTGLDGSVAIHRCSALDLPFADRTFDVAWMQNVGMNIADKPRLYAEIRRVLKSGGRFAFQEIAAGDAPPHFPVPWATEAAASFLVSADALQTLLRDRGFVAERFEDTSVTQLSPAAATARPAPGELSLAVFVDDIGRKAANMHRSLEEGRVRFVRGVFRAV